MAKVTYRAPEGDSEVVTVGGLRFFDGEAREVDPSEYARLLGKLSNNPHFEVDGPVAADDDDALGTPEGLRAVHRGRGKYAIVRGDLDEEIRTGLSKTDARAFNSMSEQDREAYIA